MNTDKMRHQLDRVRADSRREPRPRINRYGGITMQEAADNMRRNLSHLPSLLPPMKISLGPSWDEHMQQMRQRHYDHEVQRGHIRVN